MWGKLIGKLLGPIFGIIDKAVLDKDLAIKLKAQIQMGLMALSMEEIKGATSIIVAEAEGKSWIQRSWRPMTMLTFVFIIFNNYVLVPYAVAFTGGMELSQVPMLDIPPGMWGLLTVGIGGYIGGRSMEKIKGVE